MTDTVTTPTVVDSLYNWQRDALNRAGLKITEAAQAEPVTLAEAAAHLRVDAYGSPAEYADADLIEALISASREYVESLTGLLLAPQRVVLAARSFSGICRWPGDLGISLRTGPVNGIASVTYVDGDGVTQTMSAANYILDDFPMPPMLFPAFGVNSWPTARDQASAVQITFDAGYSAVSGSPTTAVIPQSLRAAILLTLGHLYENREESAAVKLETIPLGVTALCERYRIRYGFA